MESLLAACGAEMVDFPLKQPVAELLREYRKEKLTAYNSGRILELATTLGVDAIAVACPLCQMNLDLRQKTGREKPRTLFFDMPILYFTQLMGLAMDYQTRNTFGLEQLCVSPEMLLRKLGMGKGGAA